ncbi:hypothetical protein [Aliidiomarina indica]|uniref:hypothetical protein n=1 Tax=Aliidiomarina indica TaxID=2749147 RepID=UPI00188DDAFB|nr:hypothetical protein [Aliidiomarina indica]
MDLKNKFLTSYKKVKDAAKHGASSVEESKIFGKVKDVTRKTTSKISESFNEYVEDRTSLIGGDRISELKSSANPLVQLEKQKIAKHAQYAAVYFATAAGVFQNATEVTRFTRDLMDHDNAAVQTWLRRVFNPEEAKEISAWMDAAPGYSVAGGWAHRLHHGHDMDAMMQLYEEYGAVGALEWANHVWMRDFWTPHGVPYLPVGSGSLYDWLVSQGVSPSTAMSVLSINAAEAVSGIFMWRSGLRLVSACKNFVKYKAAVKCLETIETLSSKAEDHINAIELVQEYELERKFDDAPALRLELAITCLKQSFAKNTPRAAEWGHAAFNISKQLCRKRSDSIESIPYHGGTEVSLRGIAAQIIAAAYTSHVQLEKVANQEIVTLINAGISSFIELAEHQKKKRLHAGGKTLMSYRPFSAATNLNLALDLSMNIGSLCRERYDPIVIRRKLLKVLDETEMESQEAREFVRSTYDHVERTYPLSA